MLKIILILVILVSGCATNPYPNEELHYKAIKEYIGKHRYIQADQKMLEFEEKYPASIYLCEFYNFHIATAVVIKVDKFKKKYEELYSQKCEGKKHQTF